ncbi:hypothetical protein LI055_06405 [Clostridium perfringens]|uniref:HNH endonuclease n=1 Tax=Clostridium perfringens TaxID=1502 RepID=UPI002246C54E|nr:hypothetical protein [Clostridium perfringens]MCX0379255.1 hypothetical protein [Clostridium perfringens]
MININLQEKKEKIEEVFWKWFKNKNLSEFLDLLSKDEELQKIIFKSIEEYNLWIINNSNKLKEEKDYLEIKKFFFSMPKEHIEFSKKNFNISEITEKFFLYKYKNFRDSQAWKIVKILGIKTCPYCNKNFIDIYMNKSGKMKFNGDIDHYLPKWKYPYLALCIYNLVPSCKSCNNEKGDNKQSKLHFHPYRNNIKLGYNFKTSFCEENIDLDYIYGLSDNFHIKLECNGNEYMENSKEIFHLEDKYNNSKEQAKGIIRNAYIYNIRYINDMLNDYFINNNEYNRNLSYTDDIVKLIFDYEEEDKINRPLGKLKYDLLREFDLIK